MTETEALARVTELYSVDLVDDPAANPSGLFSANVDSAKKEMDLSAILPGIFGKDGTVTELQTALATERADHKTNLSAAKAEATNLTTKISELTAELSTVKAKLAEAEKQRDAFDVTIKGAEADIEKRAGLKANEILAKLGHPPLVVKPTEPGKDDIFAQFEAITDPVALECAINQWPGVGVDRVELAGHARGFKAWAATQPAQKIGMKFKAQ